MHLFVAARGQNDKLDRWENDLSSKYFPYLIRDGRRSSDNKSWLVQPNWGMLQLSVRPIRLYEIVFPEPMLEDVLKVVQPYGGYGVSPKMLMWLRKILNKTLKVDLKEIPKVAPEIGVLDESGNFIPPKTFMFNNAVDVMGIGLKEDKAVEFNKVEDI